MYYLAKFCRICIKSNVELVDIESNDDDCIKFSQKLQECTKMVISRESITRKICTQCLKKLRITYDFHSMCKRSTSLLEGLVSQLIDSSDKLTEGNFTNSEIRVTISPINVPQQYCSKINSKTEKYSILKSILSFRNNAEKDPSIDHSVESEKGGLRNIIAFTNNFDFSFTRKSESASHLGKLVKFSEDFFKSGFKDFQETVLFIIENNDYWDDDMEMFDTYPVKEEMEFEEVIIEPDIRIKTEIIEHQTDENSNLDEYSNNLSTSLVVKEESLYDENIEEQSDAIPSCPNENMLFFNLDHPEHFKSRKFPHYSKRCRTRENPYINPHLREQFMLKSFQCRSCSRYFKTPGYLKAHCVKVHNIVN